MDVKTLWLPYFRFWTSRPDETVFYYRFRDSAAFPSYDRSRDVTYFGTRIELQILENRRGLSVHISEALCQQLLLALKVPVDRA